MSNETEPRRFQRVVVSSNPFDFSNVFYHVLERMSWPVKFSPNEDQDSVNVEIPESHLTKARNDRDKFYSTNIAEIIRCVKMGASNELLLLLSGQEDEFYKLNPAVQKRLAVGEEELEACFVRAHKIFLDFMEKFPEAKKTNFPKPEDTRMYNALRKKGVLPISVSMLQVMAMRAI